MLTKIQGLLKPEVFSVAHVLIYCKLPNLLVCIYERQSACFVVVVPRYDGGLPFESLLDNLISLINGSLVVLSVVVKVKVLEDSIFMHEKAIACIFIQVKRDNRGVLLIELEIAYGVHLDAVGFDLHLHDLSVYPTRFLNEECI